MAPLAGDDVGFEADMIGNLAFWPQQDIVKAMGASKKVVFNISESSDMQPSPTGSEK